MGTELKIYTYNYRPRRKEDKNGASTKFEDTVTNIFPNWMNIKPEFRNAINTKQDKN